MQYLLTHYCPVLPFGNETLGTLENAPKHALPNGNTGTLPFGNASCFGSQKLLRVYVLRLDLNAEELLNSHPFGQSFKNLDLEAFCCLLATPVCVTQNI